VNPLEAVRGLAAELREAGVPSPRVDAEILVAEVLGISRSEVYVLGRDLSDDEVERLEVLAQRRRAREPLAYILGTWGFRGLILLVDPRVLIPRPETEVLVERALSHLVPLPEPRVLEVGVGSGAIALAIAEEHPGAQVLAVDSSREALAVAGENLKRSSVDGRVQLREGDFLQGVSGQFEAVLANPPYVTPEDYDSLQPEIRLYEPREALVGVGLGETIASAARDVLALGGRLLLECGDGQADELARKLEELGYRAIVKTRDLAGRERVVEGAWE
jgi:release factor glutamine methyltransferase